ncbi:MAG: metal ABC transporter permease [Planctomycetota bacterium]
MTPIRTRDGTDAIPPGIHEFLTLDLVPLAAVTLAAGTLALLGSFLVLRRQVLLGDAMAHAVLPGLVVGFLATGLRTPLPMFLGALGAATVASASIGLITRYGRVDRTAAIGLVYTSLFALGVLLVETAGPRNVDLDIDCVLSGQLELLFWAAPARTWAEVLSAQSLATLPRGVWVLAALFVASIAFVAASWRLLRVATFDPAFARTRGLRPGLVSFALLALTTLAIVSAFDALGSILVVALLTCPPAAARLVTDRMAPFVALATALGVAAGLAGYLAATRVAPHVLGSAVDASGSVAATAGLWLAGAACVAARKRRAR